jgi:hypothetical protein
MGEEAPEVVKRAEMKIFGAKSYFYRKANNLPPAESDDDPNPDDDQAYGFEEPEAEGEGDIDALGGRWDGG